MIVEGNFSVDTSTNRHWQSSQDDFACQRFTVIADEFDVHFDLRQTSGHTNL
jgi:hypothetical protein